MRFDVAKKTPFLEIGRLVTFVLDIPLSQSPEQKTLAAAAKKAHG